MSAKPQHVTPVDQLEREYVPPPTNRLEWLDYLRRLHGEINFREFSPPQRLALRRHPKPRVLPLPPIRLSQFGQWWLAPHLDNVLDPLETTVLGKLRRLSPARVSNLPDILTKLRLTARDESQRQRVGRMMQCSGQWWIGFDTLGPCLCTRRCRERLCPLCQRVRAAKYTSCYERALKRWKKALFITLTVRRRDEPPEDSLNRILRYFRRLRRTAVWKQSVGEGYFAVEITKVPKAPGWHVHLHVLCAAVYLDKDWLHREWFRITGDSFITGVERAGKDHPRYLARYAAKWVPKDLAGDQMWYLWEGLAGRRLAQGFGGAPPLNAEDDENASKTSSPVCTLAQCSRLAALGDEDAIQILKALTVRYTRLPADDVETLAAWEAEQEEREWSSTQSRGSP